MARDLPRPRPCGFLADGGLLRDGGDAVFSGDTLFCGGPGATGRSFSDYATIVAAIRQRLFALPENTIVHTGHGDSTTIGAEASALGR